MIRYAGRDDFEVLCAHDRHVGKSELKRCIDAQRVLVMAGSGAFMGWLRFGLFWNEIPFLNMLYVLQEYRGQSFGTRLIRHWEAEMARRGDKRVLTSTLSNERGQLFFRQNGYTDCGCLLLPDEPLEIILLKNLP